jgi:hypothetical protein
MKYFSTKLRDLNDKYGSKSGEVMKKATEARKGIKLPKDREVNARSVHLDLAKSDEDPLGLLPKENWESVRNKDANEGLTGKASKLTEKDIDNISEIKSKLIKSGKDTSLDNVIDELNDRSGPKYVSPRKLDQNIVDQVVKVGSSGSTNMAFSDRLAALRKSFSMDVETQAETTSDVNLCPIGEAELNKTEDGVDTTPTAVVSQAGTDEVVKDKEDPIKEMPNDTMIESTEVKEFSVSDRLANIRKNFGRGDGYKVATGVLGGLAGAFLMGKYAGKGQQGQAKEVAKGETQAKPEGKPATPAAQEPSESNKGQQVNEAPKTVPKSKKLPSTREELATTNQTPSKEVINDAATNRGNAANEAFRAQEELTKRNIETAENTLTDLGLFNSFRSSNSGLDLEDEEFSEVRKMAKEFKQFTLQYDNPSVAFGDWLSNSRYNDIIRDRLFKYFSK